MISVKSVTFSFGEKPVLNDINLFCGRGEIIGIAGRSGSGKSTLLNLLCGYIPVQAGVIQIDETTPRDAVRNKKVSYVFQNPTLLPWQKIKDNTLLPLRLGKKNYSPLRLKKKKSIFSLLKEFILKRHREKIGQLSAAERAMKLSHITEAAHLFPDELSGGMQTRASIARSLVYDPSVLLLDEPFSALDDIVKEQIYGDLQKVLKTLNSATVLVTHNLAEAVLLCDRVYVLNSVHQDSSSGNTITHCEVISLNRPRTLDLLEKPEFLLALKTIREKLQ